LKLSGTHPILVYADDVNIFGRKINTVKQNTKTSVFAKHETGLELNSNKTKYMVIFGDQNARRSHNTKTDYNYFERWKS
jgi:hypothetical protein